MTQNLLMNISEQNMLKKLPSVDRLLNAAQDNPKCRGIYQTILKRSIRETLDYYRHQILSQSNTVKSKDLDESVLLQRVCRHAAALEAFHLKRTVNATGVVVHTNLGRSCLTQNAMDHMHTIAGCYSNLEFDLVQGQRGSRYNAVQDLLCELSGAEAAIVVNNNAGAVLLCLDTLAHKKKVIISRGELVEIGGTFRIPDIMVKSGAILKEVGTTNRTHFQDYEKAIDTETGLLLKVHTSNYTIVGFSTAVSLTELVTLGTEFNIPVMQDLGSGCFIDFSEYKLPKEPTVQESVATGASVVTFSGDKLLGGPQAGLIVGKRAIVKQIKSNPLTRALRIDKLTLAALEATLRLYRNIPEAVNKIPTLRMLTMPWQETRHCATRLAETLQALANDQLTVTLCDLTSKVGGGALPLLELPSCCVGVRIAGFSANALERKLRGNTPPIIVRIENDQVIMDPRTIRIDEFAIITAAFDRLLNHNSSGDLT